MALPPVCAAAGSYPCMDAALKECTYEQGHGLAWLEQVRYSMCDIQYATFNVRYSMCDIQCAIFNMRYAPSRHCTALMQVLIYCRGAEHSVHGVRASRTPCSRSHVPCVTPAAVLARTRAGCWINAASTLCMLCVLCLRAPASGAECRATAHDAPGACR